MVDLLYALTFRTNELVMPQVPARPNKVTFNEEFNRSVLNSISANIAVLDSSGDIIAVNDAWTRFARHNGMSDTDMVGVGVNYLKVCREAERGGDSSARNARMGIETVLKGELAQFAYEYPCHSPKEQRWFMMKATPLTNRQGVVVIHENITARRSTEDRLQESHKLLESRVRTRTIELEKINKALQTEIYEHAEAEKRLRQAATVFENALEAIMVIDCNKNIINVNPAFTDVTGYQQEEAIGQPSSMVESKSLSAVFYEQLWKQLQHRGSWQGEIWHCRKNGEQYPVLKSVSIIKDNDGNILNYISVFSDISVIKAAEQKLSELAHHDQLTGLANRLLFSARVEQAIERSGRHKQQIALLFLDLDHFKNVNDTLGHSAGDRLLIEVGSRLRSCIRNEDTVARLGGDEFTILLEEIKDPQDAAQLANKIRQVLSNEINVDGVNLKVSTSIGISIYPDDACTAADLIRVADLAMYSAKEHGRNTYRFYHNELTNIAIERFSIENDLRRGISCDELVALYQPQFSPSTNELFGIEVLVRWNHPTQGMILPERFIKIAEESGIIHDLDELVMRTAFFQIHEWQKQNLKIPRVAINVSARELLHDHLGERIRRALHDSEIDTKAVLIELEITESVLQRSNSSMAILSNLRLCGIRISIDDFGTGYSSLSQLKRMPIDAVKIDRSFLQDLEYNDDSKEIISAIISMGHSLGLQVIAEGVENEYQLEFLRSHSCDAVQGFLLSHPLDAEAIRKYFSSKT